MNSTQFFSADDGVNGRELWKSTAFGPGTFLVANINPGVGSSNPLFIRSAETTLYFAASDGTNGTELWTLSNPLAPAPLQALATPWSSDEAVLPTEPSAAGGPTASLNAGSRLGRKTLAQRQLPQQVDRYRWATLPSDSRRAVVDSTDGTEFSGFIREAVNRILSLHSIGELKFFVLEPQDDWFARSVA